MTKLKLFATSVVCAIGMALTACGGGLSVAVPGGVQTPSITSQPVNQSVIAGQSATFSVAATGSETLSFQWKKGGADIPGATSSSYTTPATSNADSGAVFTVVVSNSAGTAISSHATLTVSAAPGAPAIGTQPANQSVVVGQTASFSVTATGVGPFTYQWKKGGADIPGATSSSYTTPATSNADSGAVFTVVVSNSAGTAISSHATLTVSGTVLAPTISAPPDNQSVVKGEAATFKVIAIGSATLAYQWKKNGTTIDGATSSTYTTPPTTSADSGTAFSVSVSNSAGSVTSHATLDVFEQAVAPSITSQPADQSAITGQTATFSVKATGTAPLIYQWQKNGTDISGATSSTYTTPATSNADNGAQYSVVVINGTGMVISSKATLTVTAAAEKPAIAPNRYSLVPKTGGTYTKEECVKDNLTGLVWEGKTASPATTRLGTSTYTNFDSTASAQKSDGTNPTQAEIDASTNSIGYKNSVNTSALCGYTDWRLPTKEELQGILANSGSPRIDTTWFPNTQADIYWSSLPYGGYSNAASVVSFSNNSPEGSYRDFDRHVRLVR